MKKNEIKGKTRERLHVQRGEESNYVGVQSRLGGSKEILVFLK